MDIANQGHVGNTSQHNDKCGMRRSDNPMFRRLRIQSVDPYPLSDNGVLNVTPHFSLLFWGVGQLPRGDFGLCIQPIDEFSKVGIKLLHYAPETFKI